MKIVLYIFLAIFSYINPVFAGEKLPSDSDLEFYKRIETAKSGAENLILQNQRLLYTFDFLTDDKIPLNHSTREMLGIYNLAYLYAETKDKILGDKVDKLLKALSARIKQVKNGQYYVFDDPEYILLGTEAIALASVLIYEKTAGNNAYADLREKLKKGLIAYFVEGEKFPYPPYSGFAWDYYAGEGWLALAIYNDMFPKDEETKQILKNIEQTMLVFNKSELGNGSHWELQAAAQRYLTTKDEKYLDFMWKIFEIYEKMQPYQNESGCAFMETLGDLAKAFRESGRNEELNRILQRIDIEKPNIYALQVLDDNIKGEQIIPERKKFIGLFLSNHDETLTRVDVAEHCTVALLKNKNQYLSDKDFSFADYMKYKKQ